MSTEQIIFFVLAASLIASSLLVIFQRNPVHSALALVASLFIVAILFLTLQAPMLAILQILGFAAGGFAVYGYLASMPYCEKCSRYLSSKGKQVRYTVDAEALQAATVQIFDNFRNGAVASAIDEHRVFGDPAYEKGNYLRSVFEIRHCQRCGQARR